MKASTLAAASACLGATLFAAPQAKVVDVRSVGGPTAAGSFEARRTEYLQASQAGDDGKAAAAFREIRRLRLERNVLNLENVALPLVARGLGRVASGDAEGAQGDFRAAIELAPTLPDAHFALATAESTQGVLGVLRAARRRVAGVWAFLSTWRGADALLRLALPTAFLDLFALTAVLAIAMVLRHGGLLLHDIEERFGPERGRVVGRGVCALLLLLPALAFQGWGFLPLWCLALLCLYMTPREKVLAALVALASVALGPAAEFLTERQLVTQNPLYGAALAAVTSGPDERALKVLEGARSAHPQDRDFAYLSARLLRQAGRDDEAAAIYRALLAADKDDPIALNNLGNIDFSNRDYPAAIARYKLVREGGAARQVEALVRYNLSLAYLQRFENQAADEARVHADRLAKELVDESEALWKFENAISTVVDLGPSAEALRRKFGPQPGSVVAENVALRPPAGGVSPALVLGLPTRMLACVSGLALLVALISLRRGRRMFTLRCLKCGTPFCRRCHLGPAVTGLCTQCHHLFVVRDGVSGPARNRKLLEVQAEDERRDGVFRALSLLSPGSGQIYARRPLVGAALTLAWYGAMLVGLLAGRVLPLAQMPSALLGREPLAATALVLLVSYVLANRLRPDFEVAAAVPRVPRRARP